jgi:mannose-6-phosphate isomerase-like protein (cupin superfamily)
MKRFAMLACAAAVAVAAADPPGFVHWSAVELRGFEKSLAPKMNEKKVAVADLAKYANHLVMVAHREASGESEIHESVADVFIVESGEATLRVGGKLVDGKSTGPGEIRGTAIEGGVDRKLAPGDVAHIPAATPHQVLLQPGKQLTYVIVKVQEK